MAPSTVDALRGARIFTGLSDEELRRVAEIASEVEFGQGHLLTEGGQIGSGMFVLLEGRVSVHARGADVELGPGEVIGELALLRRDARRVARVQALTPVRCLAIAREPFRALIVSDVHLAVALLESVADRVPD